MKKITLSFVATIFVSSLSYCQLVLEHSYNTSSVGGLDKYFYAFNTENGLNHYTYDGTTKVINIYNETHSLTNTFVAPIPVNFRISEVFFITDKLFNSDNSIEFLVFAFYNDGSTEFDKILLFNDNGTLLQEFNDRSIAGIYKTNSNTYKLILKEQSGYAAVLDVYALPGTLSINQQQLLSKDFLAFPNPTDDNLKFTNKLSNGETATIEVFDSNGKKVLKQNVAGGTGEIVIDVRNLNSGLYIYKINGETGKFIKK